MSGYTTRIGRLMEALDALNPPEQPDTPTSEHSPLLQHHHPHPPSPNPSSIEVKNLTYSTPTHHLLVQNLSFTLTQGAHIFVTGPSGSGKSTLVRILAGLYRGEGEVAVPGDVMFLPQRAYVVPKGTLREQVTYPVSVGSGGEDVEERVVEALRMAEVGYLAQRWTDEVVSRVSAAGEDWTRGLSGGERQRVALARVLFWRPRFVVLDEATGSLDVGCEGRVLGRVFGCGITCLVVGHGVGGGEGGVSGNLGGRRVVLDGMGGWRLEAAVADG
ncbi:hypothetical protein HDV00_008930 [Rhizophlyctis rosea]|nr:hypothetical protein HDV00_008930 [Rhizophlyctis rosea]